MTSEKFYLGKMLLIFRQLKSTGNVYFVEMSNMYQPGRRGQHRVALISWWVWLKYLISDMLLGIDPPHNWRVEGREGRATPLVWAYQLLPRDSDGVTSQLSPVTTHYTHPEPTTASNHNLPAIWGDFINTFYSQECLFFKIWILFYQQRMFSNNLKTKYMVNVT